MTDCSYQGFFLQEKSCSFLFLLRLFSGVKKLFIFQHSDGKVTVRNDVVVTHLTNVSGDSFSSFPVRPKFLGFVGSLLFFGSVVPCSYCREGASQLLMNYMYLLIGINLVFRGGPIHIISISVILIFVSHKRKYDFIL